MTPEITEVPSLVPARMVNQFVFCPRFFHLAWSSGEVGENDLTVEGKWIHRNVDTKSGDVSFDQRARSARALELSSESLGVIARLDVVETEAGVAVPVEFKRGSGGDADHPVWEPERIQLALHGLLLREHGFVCDHGEVYFAGSKDRVTVQFDEPLLQRTTSLLESLRTVAADPVPPPPLVDSVKCKTCIMQHACLPDEHNLLRSRSAAAPRRLLPTDSASRPVYVTDSTARVGIEGERLSIKSRENDDKAYVRLIDVSQVAIFGNAQVSTQAVRELASRDVPVCWFSGGGWFYAMTDHVGGGNVELRRRVATLSGAEQLSIARNMIEGKILNARSLYRRNTASRNEDAISEMKRLALRATRCDSEQELLGIEGGAARIYFSEWNSLLRDEMATTFRFEKRSRRPPADPVNCLLSFNYGLLVKDCVVTLKSVGFDPYLGVFHRPRFGRPALALDIAEEFRPLIADSAALRSINNGEIKSGDFVVRAGGVGLTPAGRKKALVAYEQRLATEFKHPIFGYKITYRRAIEVQARVLGATVLGEIPAYRPIVTR